MKSPIVRIVEVGPRDGLQAIEQTIPTEIKIELIQRLATTGLRSIEVTSFTSPKWIPQLADHEQVMEAVHKINDPSVIYSVLVPNLKGLLAAVKAGANQVGVFVSASEGFSRENNNCSVAEAVARAKEVADQAAKLGVAIRG
jgi:hydroxymethylglutaryl-CoA lyase